MNSIASIIIYYSSLANIDPAIVNAIVKQESNFNVQATGALKEAGLMQIRPEFITIYTNKELYSPEINIKMGIELLKQAKEKCVHKKNLDWVICYNMGITKGNKIKFPSKNKYVINVNKYYEEYKNGTKYTNSLYKNRQWLACF